jgi:hypothetical protein
MGDWPSVRLQPTQNNTNTTNAGKHHASSGIETHDVCSGVGEDTFLALDCLAIVIL